jgi:hypothetical protein
VNIAMRLHVRQDPDRAARAVDDDRLVQALDQAWQHDRRKSPPVFTVSPKLTLQ